MRTSEEQCIEALIEAADRLGESPTKAQYEELGLTPAANTILRVMGGWNAAKQAAGLETYSQSEGGRMPVQSKPDWVELPDGYEWTELNPQQRWYYKNRDKRVEVKSQRKAELRQWFHELKRDEYECANCGETHPSCLDFHHVGEKRMGISEMVTLGHAREKILAEIEACEALCANCHRKEHARASR